MKSRIISLILALVLTSTLLAQVSLPVIAADVSGKCGNNLIWSFEESTGTLRITGTGEMQNWTSPSQTPWYSYLSSIKSLIIERQVTTIGSFAFSGSALKSLSIINSVTSIGADAFYGCKSLNSLIIGNNVTSIGADAFSSCTSLTNVTIPGSVSRIDVGLFRNCNAISNVIISDGVNSIGGAAFAYCIALKSITIPSSVTSIDNSAFANCTALISVQILNPSCSINNNKDSLGIPGTTIIKGYRDSTAQKYAEKNGYSFVAIEPNAVDTSFERDKKIYTEYLISEGFDGFLANPNANTIHSLSSAMYDFDYNGVYELFLKVIVEATGYNYGQYTDYFIYTIRNGDVTQLLNIRDNNGTWMGASMGIAVDSDTGKPVICATEWDRQGVEYYSSNTLVYSIQNGTVIETAKKNATQILTITDNSSYKSMMNTVRKETNLFVVENGYDFLFFKIDGKYVSQADYNARFTDPTDEDLLLKEGTIDNPIPYTNKTERPGEELLDCYSGPGTTYVFLGKALAKDCEIIAKEKSFYQVEVTIEGTLQRAYVLASSLGNGNSIPDVVELSIPEYGPISPDKKVIYKINKKITVFEQMDVFAVPSRAYLKKDRLKNGDEIILLYPENEEKTKNTFYLIEYHTSNGLQRGYINNVDYQQNELNPLNNFDAVKSTNACFLKNGHNYYSAYSSLDLSSNSMTILGPSWKLEESFTIHDWSFDPWKAIVGFISAGEPDVKIAWQGDNDYFNKSTEKDINTLFNSWSLVLGFFEGVETTDYRINLERYGSDHRLIIYTGAPFEIPYAGKKMNLGALLMAPGSYSITQDQFIRQIFTGLKPYGEYSMEINFGKDYSMCPYGSALVIKNDGTVLAYPIIHEGTTMPVYFTNNGKTELAFDAAQVFACSGYSLDKSAAEVLFNKLREKGFESSFAQHTIKCPVDVSVFDENHRLILQTKDNNIQIDEDDGISVDLVRNAKVIRCPYDKNYYIDVTSNDYGEMDYVMSCYENGQITKRAAKNDIKFNPDAVFHCAVNKNGLFTLTKENGELLIDSYSEYKTSELLNVAISSEQGGKVYGIPYLVNKSDLISLSACAEEGYSFAGWYVGDDLLYEYEDISFIAENDLTLIARFDSIDLLFPCDGGNNCPGKMFIDMTSVGSWSHDPIDWAIVNGITNGTDATHFSPDKTCTRAQVVTFLWRSAGSPEPTSASNPFTDVKADAYYYKAVLWAVEKGITTGTSATKFSPNSGCTRGQVVTFLWRFFDQSEPKSVKNPFTDVKEDQYYCKAVLWAVEKGVTKGTSATKFSPGSTCTRGQIVTFLYRAKDDMDKPAKTDNHRYEFVIDNCSWHDAQIRAAEKGGKLVCFETNEEYEQFIEFLQEYGEKNTGYLLGGRRALNDTDYFWVDSDLNSYGDPLNSDDAWSKALWLAGEPSYSWQDEQETVIELYFSEKENRWVWNDVPEDRPRSTLAKYGYIVEYN